MEKLELQALTLFFWTAVALTGVFYLSPPIGMAIVGTAILLRQL